MSKRKTKAAPQERSHLKIAPQHVNCRTYPLTLTVGKDVLELEDSVVSIQAVNTMRFPHKDEARYGFKPQGTTLVTITIQGNTKV